ncbi:MAG: hypothetical protein M5U19_16540 [Microthrixaceae bacterium]|nr:hypothetical protein [Microthrixaceae bacterium]
MFAVVVGWSRATESPWLLCLLSAVGLAAYGWGQPRSPDRRRDRRGDRHGCNPGLRWNLRRAFRRHGRPACHGGPCTRRSRGPVRPRRFSGQPDWSSNGEGAGALNAANVLLEELTEIALTLPGAFTLREVLDRTRQLLRAHIDPRTVVLMTIDEASGEWTPKITDRASMRASYHRRDLPPPLLVALESGETPGAAQRPGRRRLHR